MILKARPLQDRSKFLKTSQRIFFKKRGILSRRFNGSDFQRSDMAERENFWKGWRERFSALPNVPRVLRIVWESGPVVVGLGLAFRFLASFVPVLALWITKLIIDTIVRAVA